MKQRERVVAAVLAVLAVVAYIVVLGAYHAEVGGQSATYTVSTSDAPDHIAVDARLLSVDPIKDEAVFRLAFAPAGALADSGGALTEALVMTVDSATGNVERTFPKGKLMAPSDVTADLSNGEVTDFPFDRHQTVLRLFFAVAPAKAVGTSGSTSAGTSGSTSGDTSGAPAATGDASGGAVVPVRADVNASLHGYHIDLSAGSEEGTNLLEVNLDVARAGSTVVFSIFVMVLMWLLALAAFSVAWRCTFRGLKPELAMFTFMTAMLFAFPAIRNVLPGTPPIGSFTDFLAFFWAEALVAVSLVTVVFRWLRWRPS